MHMPFGKQSSHQILHIWQAYSRGTKQSPMRESPPPSPPPNCVGVSNLQSIKKIGSAPQRSNLGRILLRVHLIPQPFDLVCVLLMAHQLPLVTPASCYSPCGKCGGLPFRSLCSMSLEQPAGNGGLQCWMGYKLWLASAEGCQHLFQAILV